VLNATLCPSPIVPSTLPTGTATLSSINGSKRGIHRDLLADIGRADFVQAEAAVLHGNLEPRQVERRGLSQQLARELPVVRVEPLLSREHVLAHELGGRLAEHALFIGEVLAHEDLVWTNVVGEELTAASRVVHVSRHRLRTSVRLTDLPTGQYKRRGMPTIKELFDLTGRVETIQANGPNAWTVGLVGTQTERFRKVTLTASELQQLRILDPRLAFDADGRLLRLTDDVIARYIKVQGAEPDDDDRFRVSET
jgi:hypothetical protein